MQSKKHSAAEALANTAIGFGVSLGSQLLIFPLYGIHVPLESNLSITLWFTGVSLLRGYVLRRFFTKRTEGE